MSSTPTGTRRRPPIERGDRIPDFTAPAADGETVSTRRYYLRRILALVFTHRWPCAACQDYLRAIAEQIEAIRAEAGEVVAVLPLGPEVALGNLATLPFPVALADDVEIHERYGLAASDGRPLAGVVIADRTGTVYEVDLADEAHRLLDPEEIRGWLEFVSYECSECWVDRAQAPRGR